MNSLERPRSTLLPQTFPARARLRERSSFDRVFADSIRSSDDVFTVLARSNAVAHARVGVAVPRKVTRSAVQRNRIKRVVRESFRLAQHRLPAVDIVVLARAAAAGAARARLRCSLDWHWDRIRARCEA